METVLNYIWPCMILAAFIGAIAGWIFRRCNSIKIDNDDNHTEVSKKSYLMDIEPEQQNVLNEENIRLHMQLSKAQSQVKSSELKLKTLQDEYFVKNRDFNDHNKIVTSLKNDLTQKEKNLADTKSQLKELEKELASKDELLNSTKSSMIPLKEKLERSSSQIEGYKTEINKLKEMLQEHEDEKKVLHGKLGELEKNLSQNNIATIELEKKQQELDEYKQKLASISNNSDLADTKSQLKELEKELASKDELLNSTKSSMIPLNAEIEQYKIEMSELKKRLKSYEEKRNEETQLTDMYKQKLASLSSRLEDEQKRAKDLADKNSTLQQKANYTTQEIQQVISTNVKAKSIGKKPRLLDKPEGKIDDLKLIKGIGPKLENVLHDLGIFHFRQIANWNEDEVDWVNDHLVFSGRIEREKWIEQAKKLIDAREANKGQSTPTESTSGNGEFKRYKHKKKLRKKW